MTEEWRESIMRTYEVSNLGNVRRSDSKAPTKLYKTSDKSTWYVTMSDRAKRMTCTVPRLVALAFNEEYANDPDSYSIKFKDGDNTNCRLDNLIITEKVQSYFLKTLSYKNDLFIVKFSETSIKKMKNTIVTITTNGVPLYDYVFITLVVKRRRGMYELYGHEVHNRKSAKHATLDLDFSKGDDIKNEFVKI